MRILLLNAPDKTGLYFYRKKSLHIGLLYLYAALKKKYDTRLIDMNYTDEKIERIINKAEPDVVGLSCYSSNRHIVFDICRRIKAVNKDMIIVLGGYHATFLYKQVLKNYPVDYIIVGEGEKSFPRLVESIRNKKKVPHGVAYIRNDKVSYIPSEESVNINEFSPIDYTPYKKYLKSRKQRESFIPVLSFSRGCVYNCKFCNRYVCEKYQRMSLKNAFDNIKNLADSLPFERLIIADNNFYMKDRYFESICNHIIREKYDYKLTARGRVDNISNDKISLMQKAGTDVIFFGVESGNQRILNLNNKQIKIQQIIQAFDKTKKMSMDTSAYLILGLYGETVSTIKDTERLVSRINPTYLVLRKCVITPGCELYDNLVKTGQFNEENWLKRSPYFIYKGNLSSTVLNYYKSKIILKHKILSGKK